MNKLSIIFLFFFFGILTICTAKSNQKKQTKTNIKPKSLRAELMEYHNKGILFFAKGNSPEWSFEVDQSNNKIIRFLSSTGMIFTAPYSEPFKNFNSPDYHYNFKTVLGHLKVVMKPKKSKIAGDSKEYSYEVTVDVKYERDPNYQHYEGVGMFVPDFSLEGKWMLEQLNGTQVKRNKNNPVYLNLDLIQNKYQGFNSCNAIGGNLIFEGSKKQFFPGESTLKACEGMMEADFMRVLLAAIIVEQKNKKLVLKDTNGNQAVFTR
jgi:heat shock protein HslJ